MCPWNHRESEGENFVEQIGSFTWPEHRFSPVEFRHWIASHVQCRVQPAVSNLKHVALGGSEANVRNPDLRIDVDLPPQKWTGLSRSAFGLGGADIAQ